MHYITRPRDTSDSLITMNAEVQRATAIYFSASAQLQHYETKHASIDNRDESTHYDPRANDAERMSEGRHEMVHETALFYGVTYGTKIIAITPSDYTKCPDFAVIYDTCRAAKNDSTPHPKISDEIQRRRESKQTRATIQRKVNQHTQGRDVPVYEPPEQEIRNYTIERELLYYHATDGTLRLCIPDPIGGNKDGSLTLRQQFINHVHNNHLHVHLGEN